MAKDKKKNKAQTMSLHEFVGPNGGQAAAEAELDWAQDAPEEHEVVTDATTGVPRKVYARTAGNVGNFREGTTHTNSRVVDYNMEKPYLGFVANLLTNLPEQEVRDFFADADIGIENIKMVYKERSTFAFVEFETPQSLQMALLLEGKFLKNRPIKVDIATQDQREKMMNERARATRDPKTPNSGGLGSFDRETMGNEQRSFNSLGDRRNPRSGTSQGAPRDFEFSREVMGGAQPELADAPVIGGNRRTPNVSSPTTGFPNFRDGERQEQPTLERRPPRQPLRDGGSSAAGGGLRGSKAASPVTKEAIGNWRDQPAASQPSLEKRPAPQSGDAPSQPKKDLAPPRPSVPKTNAWASGDAGDRFAALRK